MNIDEIIMRASAIKLLANVGDKQAVFEECDRIIAICEAAAKRRWQWTAIAGAVLGAYAGWVICRLVFGG